MRENSFLILMVFNRQQKPLIEATLRCSERFHEENFKGNSPKRRERQEKFLWKMFCLLENMKEEKAKR
jgi:hypothetical protein